MWNSVVISELHDLRVNQNQLHLVRIRFIDKTRDDTVDANRLARAGRARDQQMRHGLQIRNDRVAADILADCEGDLGLALFERLRVNDFAQSDHRYRIIFDLDANCRFARNRRFNTNRLCLQVQRDIVSKPYDAADLHADRRLNLITRDRRSLRHLHHSGIHMEVSQCFLQLLCLCRKHMRIRFPSACGLLQKGNRRLLVYLRHLLRVDFFRSQHSRLRVLVRKLFYRGLIRCTGCLARKRHLRLPFRLADFRHRLRYVSNINGAL